MRALPLYVAVVVAALAALAAAVSAFSSVSSPAAPVVRAQFISPPMVLTHYGHVRSVARSRGRYELKFDPAFWLGGMTANRAAAEDGAIRPGEGVPNDYYIRDEGGRTLTFFLPARARVTMLTFSASQGTRSTRIPVAEFAQLVQGRNPKNRQLFARNLGYWMKIVDQDTIRSLDQQYRP
jgi:hypothetical protein